LLGSEATEREIDLKNEKERFRVSLDTKRKHIELFSKALASGVFSLGLT
jgi:hypothetical protein